MNEEQVHHHLAEKLLGEMNEREGAVYKIDLLLASGFSTRRPSAGMISFWDSGRALHGDGDTKLYVCPGKYKGINDCESVIRGFAQGHTNAVCARCGGVWKSADLIGEIAYRLEITKWADVLLKWYRKLDMQADIRIIYPPDDIRSLAAREQDKQMGGELMEPARGRRATRAYPQRNIIKDTSTGADLHGRLVAFLRA